MMYIHIGEMLHGFIQLWYNYNFRDRTLKYNTLSYKNYHRNKIMYYLIIR